MDPGLLNAIYDFRNLKSPIAGLLDVDENVVVT